MEPDGVVQSLLTERGFPLDPCLGGSLGLSFCLKALFPGLPFGGELDIGLGPGLDMGEDLFGGGFSPPVGAPPVDPKLGLEANPSCLMGLEAIAFLRTLGES